MMAEREFEKICVLGLGYIGLPTALVLAGRGYKIVGVDINENVVNLLKEGKVHIVEPDLEALMKSALKRKKLMVKNKVEPADIFFICVPTPVNEEHAPGLKHVFEATESIAPYLRKGNLVILESTSPVNTSKKVAEMLEERTGLTRGKEFYLAYCPERVLPGAILKEIIENDRVIGGINKESAQKANKLYSSFVNGRIYLTDAVTAEMAKLVENTYRDINIAFANQLSIMCAELNISVWNLIKIANRHPRVNIHKPGPGVGG
ncbi:MAG: nucleotide sugar dehydrogenase, partial [Elusimicrobia bacterium]|nr:nucleotide sugar dehydrogenase [Elusimicrobiota bacterium]